jgi:hypothetical protein
MLTDASILLLKDTPMSMTPYVQAMLVPILTNPWHQLSTWFKSDDPTTFKTAHGISIWDYAANEPNFNNLFNNGMASDARLITSVVIEKCAGVFNEFESLVDVGGGTGTMAKVLAKSFPKMNCIVFDLPHVVAGFQGSENLKYVGGDMFKEIPPADAILLKVKCYNFIYMVIYTTIFIKMFKFYFSITFCYDYNAKVKGYFDDRDNLIIRQIYEKCIDI